MNIKYYYYMHEMCLNRCVEYILITVYVFINEEMHIHCLVIALFLRAQYSNRFCKCNLHSKDYVQLLEDFGLNLKNSWDRFFRNPWWILWFLVKKKLLNVMIWPKSVGIDFHVIIGLKFFFWGSDLIFIRDIAFLMESSKKKKKKFLG